MGTSTNAKSTLKAPRRTRQDKLAAFEKFAAEFGPKPGEKPGQRSGTGGAVDFLIKLRRGEAIAHLQLQP